MKKYLNTPALAATIILTIVLEYLMSVNEVELSTRIIGGILFFATNFVVLALLIHALTVLLRVLRLPGLKVKTYAYHLYPVALVILYIAFLLVMGRLAEYFISAYQLAGIIVAGVIALIIAQLGGSIPDRLFTQKKHAIRLENAGGMLGGFEILGSLIGTYRDGVLLGTDAIPFSLLESMHRSKDSIIIEGSVDPKVELIIVAEKAQDYFISVLADRLKVPRGGLDSALSHKHKGTLDRLKDHKVEPRKEGLRRAKPVKLIEKQKAGDRPKAGESVKTQPAARSGVAKSKPKV